MHPLAGAKAVTARAGQAQRRWDGAAMRPWPISSRTSTEGAMSMPNPEMVAWVM